MAYLDVIGSGVETIAHLKENGRIVLMFCAFQGPPNIVRIYGMGPRGGTAGGGIRQDGGKNFQCTTSTRSIIVVDVTRVSDSCGYGVPLMKYEGERSQLHLWAEKKGPEGLKTYRQQKNRHSIDGLPGVAE